MPEAENRSELRSDLKSICLRAQRRADELVYVHLAVERARDEHVAQHAAAGHRDIGRGPLRGVRVVKRGTFSEDQVAAIDDGGAGVGVDSS